MKMSDMFMHWDDLCLCASFYAGEPKKVVVDGVVTEVVPTIGQKVTACFSRMLPLAMMMAGYQVGCKGLERAPKRKQPPRPLEHPDLKCPECKKEGESSIKTI